ncbi:hypothetical protein SAMN04487968_10635 [Nocardioides terrae]|uniref:CDP-Glycerol:Poly(Glycerophosphate) glycerophosphotransferase n=1 Tax=Nocardioides terrae TaxID=574651 RepID=A0A1I1IR65_9ACTN|nr:glycosyltransferase family 1 protein [Nocardioides terrae]SFC38431.1 hypothetical protein SAMN04487968_10635 [Nocardioides terrae]
MTRPTAIVTYLWEKHLGALDDFLVTHPVDAVVVDAHHLNDRLHGIVERHGCTLVTLQQKFAETAAFRDTALTAVGDLRDRLDGTEWVGEGMVASPGEIPRLRALLSEAVGVHVPAAVMLLNALGAIRKVYDLKLFVTSEDVQSMPKVATAWARARHIPSLHVAHSLALVDPYTVHAHLVADVLAVYGDRGAEGYLDLGIEPHRIVSTGNPAWDVYSRLRGERSAVRERLVDSYDLDPGLPIVTFGTTHSGRMTASDTGNAHRDSLAAFLAAVAEMEQRGVAFQTVVKDRMSNIGIGDELLTALLENSGVRQRVTYANDDTSEWAVASDILVGVDSNYLVEAMLAGTPAVNLIGVGSLPAPPPFDGASGVVEAEPGELATRLASLLEDDDLRARQLDLAARRLDHYHRGGTDGLATARVAELMVSLARRGRPAGPRPVEPTAPDIPPRSVASSVLRRALRSVTRS